MYIVSSWIPKDLWYTIAKFLPIGSISALSTFDNSLFAADSIVYKEFYLEHLAPSSFPPSDINYKDEILVYYEVIDNKSKEEVFDFLIQKEYAHLIREYLIKHLIFINDGMTAEEYIRHHCSIIADYYLATKDFMTLQAMRQSISLSNSELSPSVHLTN